MPRKNKLINYLLWPHMRLRTNRVLPVAIGNPELHMRKASHRGSKQQ